MKVASHPRASEVWDAPPSGPIGLDADQSTLLGCGEDLGCVVRAEYEALTDFRRIPASRQKETVEEEFKRLASEWRRDTAVLSSVPDIAMHPAYQQIIGMGNVVLPFVFRELETRPDHWFWALKAITGTDPVPPGDRGDMHRMASAWIRWACESGYL